MHEIIFLLEVDRHSREGLRDSFVRSGYTVEAAADGSQALDKIGHRPFDVAIIDLDLPARHGSSPSSWEVVRTFRAHHPTAPIVVVSAEDHREWMLRADELGVSAFLEKPISLTHLKAVVRWVHPQEGPARPAGGLAPSTRPAPKTEPPEEASRAGRSSREGGASHQGVTWIRGAPPS